MFEEFSFGYARDFYKYVLIKKSWEFTLFVLVTFVLSLLPYILVSINMPESSERGYYGDGSILTLCSGVLCSYFTILFNFDPKILKKDFGPKTGVICLVLFIIYVLVLIQFYHCQMNFDRQWPFIWWIIGASGILLCITVFFAAYLHFHRDIQPLEIKNFAEELQRKKVEKQASVDKKGQDGVSV